jgi:hypothetical protein
MVNAPSSGGIGPLQGLAADGERITRKLATECWHRQAAKRDVVDEFRPSGARKTDQKDYCFLRLAGRRQDRMNIKLVQRQIFRSLLMNYLAFRCDNN